MLVGIIAPHEPDLQIVNIGVSWKAALLTKIAKRKLAVDKSKRASIP